MSRTTFLNLLFSLLIILSSQGLIYGQQVPIIGYNTDTEGRVQLTVASSIGKYYVLKVRHDLSGGFDLTASITMGQAGTTQITESLAAYPQAYYQVLEYAVGAAHDTDRDGVDDITEYQNFPTQNPINPANPISINDGAIAIDSFTLFNQLSISRDLVQWSEFLNGKRFAKFIIVDFNTAPKVYFINGNTHNLHADFANAIGISTIGNDVKKGQIIYHPTTISNNGTLGTFAFNYSNGHGDDFEVVQKTHELLAANMPFLTNNLSYFVTTNSQIQYEQDSGQYTNSRVPVLFEAEVYAQVDYWGLNEAEGFGLFREMAAGDIPGIKDIVLYSSLPNTLPRVGGIITSVIQTPLSHVNLRAIQDGVPNAFIRDPLLIDSVANLLGHYIYFKVEQDQFFIREASLEEVNNWFEKARPDQNQTSPLNLDYTSILPLDEITFSMFDGFGAKCANVATMRTFGFPAETIPDGFGVPFYFYQEFMKHNHFFEVAREMLKNPDFRTDRNLRDAMLAAFRKKIEKGEMPYWMLDQLAEMQASFPENTSIRCRSSTNNEDLPGFNGAGLYASNTQHPNEGHIAKSIQQIYASLWNLRAFDEREFYRVNHLTASMGVLCHSNYSDEKANGVGVSTDPMYQTNDAFYYLNSQVGEDLITNPNNTAVPEELLLDIVATSATDYIVLQHSSLVPNKGLILERKHLDQIRAYLTVIHNKFEVLYNAVGNPTFAMEIEYKITADNQLVIKQARPWVAYLADEDSRIIDLETLDFKIFPNPIDNRINIEWVDCNPTKVLVLDLLGRKILEKNLNISTNSTLQIPIEDLPRGVYVLTAFAAHHNTYTSKKFIKK
ncbi:PEP/pyruvate-binding domain-containing protein [Aureispira anguillae]|uniref:Phosphoenolpyruvate synthase n=1 Tax=Aureispira anguillae TaxID=2864201 RepID=A0A915YE09_9BACT|nr:PEP/pyruvate-binding domain-containing protein [Aureispira anguillae]BDS11387.1 T9SS type A sorting domain-containing protein [Aureispira anguillae]